MLGAQGRPTSLNAQDNDFNLTFHVSGGFYVGEHLHDKLVKEGVDEGGVGARSLPLPPNLLLHVLCPVCLVAGSWFLCWFFLSSHIV